MPTETEAKAEEKPAEQMFYHVEAGLPGLVSFFMGKNLTLTDVLHNYVCPFLNKEVILLDNEIINMPYIGSMQVYKTKQKVDSDWPIKKDEFVAEYRKKHKCNAYNFEYINALDKKIKEVSEDVTAEMCKEAVEMIHSGKYVAIQMQLKRL